MKMILITLPCANDKEASKIVQKILDEKLAVCVKRVPTESASLWNGKIEQDHEVLLLIESVEKKFEEIEEIVKKIHSYETPVLTAVPVVRSSAGTKEWLKEELE